MDKQIPTGVKIISVLYYIGAVLTFIFGLILLFSADALSEFIPGLGTLGIVGGIVLMGFGVLSFFIGRGLWKGSNWARIVAIILAVLGIISAIYAMTSGAIGSNIINLLINLLIGWYLT